MNLNANFRSEFIHSFLPHFKIFFPFILPDKILELHLLKLSLSENKIPWRNFVSKCLADLSYSERKFRMMRIYEIFKINKDSLCCLCSKMRSCSLFASAYFYFKYFVAKVFNMARSF